MLERVCEGVLERVWEGVLARVWEGVLADRVSKVKLPYFVDDTAFIVVDVVLIVFTSNELYGVRDNG